MDIIPSEFATKIATVLAKLRLGNPVLLGKGGEGWVYAYGPDALKIYPRATNIQYLRNIQAFQSELSNHKFSFSIPHILQVEQVDGVIYTIERKLQGIPMDKKLINLPTLDRQKLYKNYYEAIRQINQVKYQNFPFGQIIETEDAIVAKSWTAFLTQKIDQMTEKTRAKMLPVVPDFDKKVSEMKSLIVRDLQSENKSLVHGDYFLNNVLVGENLEITAILDFSVHAVVGDPRMDIASVLTWNELDTNVRPDDYLFLFEQAEEDYGASIRKIADIYLLYSSFYFAEMDDANFSVTHLNDEALWRRVS